MQVLVQKGNDSFVKWSKTLWHWLWSIGPFLSSLSPGLHQEEHMTEECEKKKNKESKVAAREEIEGRGREAVLLERLWRGVVVEMFFEI